MVTQLRHPEWDPFEVDESDRFQVERVNNGSYVEIETGSFLYALQNSLSEVARHFGYDNPQEYCAAMEEARDPFEEFR